MTEVALTFLVRKRCKSKINLHMSKKSCIFAPDFAMLKVRLHFFALIHKFGIAEFLPDLFPFVA